MITTFSINRVKLLLTKYFVERWKGDLRDFVMVFALCAVFSFNCEVANVGVFVFAMFCFVSASKFYSMFKNSSRGLDYLLIPANTLEKTVAGILLVQVYRVAIYFIALVLGVKFGSFMYSLHPWNTNGIVSIKELFSWLSNDWNYILSFISAQALFLFVSAFFKKSAFVKTLLFLFIFTVAAVIVTVFIASMMDMSGLTSNNDAQTFILLENLDLTFANMTPLGKITTIGSGVITTLFYWVMTYLRLREKEA